MQKGFRHIIVLAFLAVFVLCGTAVAAEQTAVAMNSANSMMVFKSNIGDAGMVLNSSNLSGPESVQTGPWIERGNGDDGDVGQISKKRKWWRWLWMYLKV